MIRWGAWETTRGALRRWSRTCSPGWTTPGNKSDPTGSATPTPTVTATRPKRPFRPAWAVNTSAFPDGSLVRLSRVLADWGQGASFSTGGRGAPSEPGDATWIHTFYDTDFWNHTGGQFVGSASAAFVVNGPGEYLVTGDLKMLADVRLWKAAPSHNFGWILIGDEGRPQSVQPFASRESPDPAAVPVLEIVYRLPADRS